MTTLTLVNAMTAGRFYSAESALSAAGIVVNRASMRTARALLLAGRKAGALEAYIGRHEVYYSKK